MAAIDDETLLVSACHGHYQTGFKQDIGAVADIAEKSMQYLYNDGEFWYFMDPDSFEQVNAGGGAVGDNAKWLKEQDLCAVILWNGNVTQRFLLFFESVKYLNLILNWCTLA